MLDLRKSNSGEASAWSDETVQAKQKHQKGPATLSQRTLDRIGNGNLASTPERLQTVSHLRLSNGKITTVGAI